MGRIKHPKGTDSITAQTEGGDHPRGTDTQNYERAQPGLSGGKPGYGAGKHFRDAPGGVPDDQYNPGIGSSPGSRASGESPINETDETTGVTPRAK
jgi:hypothetical protein